MYGVIEIHVFWQTADAGPDQRRIGGITLPHDLKHPGIGPDLRMAGHADMGGRHSRRCSGLHVHVAVAAINAEFPSMVLMAELCRLLFDDIPASDIAGVRQAFSDDDHRDDGEEAGPKDKAKDGVSTRLEKLRHVALR